MINKIIIRNKQHLLSISLKTNTARAAIDVMKHIAPKVHINLPQQEQTGLNSLEPIELGEVSKQPKYILNTSNTSKIWLEMSQVIYI